MSAPTIGENTPTPNVSHTSAQSAAQSAAQSSFEVLDKRQTPDVNWPVSPMPLRCGIYVLPGGLVHVAPHSLFHIRWEKVERLNRLSERVFGVWQSDTVLVLAAKNTQQLKVLNSLIEQVVATTGCQEAELKKFCQPKAKIQSPQKALFSPWDSSVNWRGANLSELGTRRLADGCYFTREGVWFIYGCSIESFRWDDVKSIQWGSCRIEVESKMGEKFLFPERLMERIFTESMMVEFKKKTAQYWLSAPCGPDDTLDKAGHAVPRSNRPTKIQVVKIDLWS